MTAAARLYDAALTLAAPLMRARLAWRARREPGYGEHVGERFGRYDAGVRASIERWRTTPGARLWLHAVSLGETRAAAALVAALRERRPDLRVLWTHGTATGRDAGAQALRGGDLQLWQPFDAPAAVRRFLEAVEPPCGVLMETEIWPNLLGEARRRGIPMVLANARLSDRSLARGQRVRTLLEPAVAGLAQVLAQTAEDAGRLVSAGADPRRVQVCGNLKFDMTPPPGLLALGRAWKRTLQRPVVMMASSREGEEGPLLAAWSRRLAAAAAQADGPGVRPLLLVVPRHPQRFDAVAAMAVQAGFAVARRRDFGEAMPDRVACAADVWIGDSLGEMPAYYATADSALLGGSFAPLGGQNLIEAAACGCPVLMGPHTFNFDEAARGAAAVGAAVRCPTLDAAVDTAWNWLLAARPGVSGARPGADAHRARAFAGQHRGAAARMAATIDPLLGPRPGRSAGPPAVSAPAAR